MGASEYSVNDAMTLRAGEADSLGRIDQYSIVRELGGGGFGTVYLATDTISGVPVAIKGLPPIVRGNREELESIRANFALVSRLSHSNIAKALVLHRANSVSYTDESVRGKLRVDRGDTLMVMDYAPGVTLSQWRRQFPGGRVPCDKALAIVRQVAAALDYAHGRKILHRDVKPANVMVETKDDGSLAVRILDFGLAAEIRSSMGRVSQEVHDTSGTRPYMAPEQWLGNKQGPATDQYALAVLFHELLTGEVPFASVFETGDPVVMMNVVGREPPKLSADCRFPKAVRRAILKALSKKPEDRFATCADFVAALERGGGPGCATAFVALLAVLALAAVGGWLVWERMPKGAEASASEQQPANGTTVVQTPEPVPEPTPEPAPQPDPDPQPGPVPEPMPQPDPDPTPDPVPDTNNVDVVVGPPGDTPPSDDDIRRKEREDEERRKADEQRKEQEERLKKEREAKKAAASTERGHALVKANSAKAAGAMTYAQDTWNAATTNALKRGDAALASGDYDGAGKAFAEAGELYDKAKEAAEAKRKAEYEAKRKAEEAKRFLERLDGEGFILDAANNKYKPGAVKTLSLPRGESLVLMWCPPGWFMMGSPESEEERQAGETRHPVQISKGFWMGKFEVTRSQWGAITGDGSTGRKPVSDVSWQDVTRYFIEQLNRELHGAAVMRLPTEAEWEYACRAGQQTPFSFGSANDGEFLDGTQASCAGRNTYPRMRKTLLGGNNAWGADSVGSFPAYANDWGLCDMHGNVYEWCDDYYSPYPTGGALLRDPRNARVFSDARVMRGGCWNHPAKNCRSAFRTCKAPGDSDQLTGFRVCCDDLSLP